MKNAAAAITAPAPSTRSQYVNGLRASARNSRVMTGSTFMEWGRNPCGSASAYAATVTVDLTNYAAYAAIIVNVGTLTGNITFDITNGTDGQVIRVWFTQDGTGSRIFTAGSHLAFSTDTPSPTLTTTASKVDSLGFQWRSAEAKALMVAVNHGFA